MNIYIRRKSKVVYWALYVHLNKCKSRNPFVSYSFFSSSSGAATSSSSSGNETPSLPFTLSLSSLLFFSSLSKSFFKELVSSSLYHYCHVNYFIRILLTASFSSFILSVTWFFSSSTPPPRVLTLALSWSMSVWSRV